MQHSRKRRWLTVCVPYVFLLDYEEGLHVKNEKNPVGFVLNKNFNADFTHMNSALLPLLEKSIVESHLFSTGIYF